MIIEIYQDTPAMEAGLQVGDIIAGVNGQDVAGKTATEISDLVRGKLILLLL
ncbi:PDZ domain-containing protein [Coprobacillaceae bacterium CR2/5/TPMF4]|nr:PDZ domain-containing protein [Coprobacillaceae bacterium CR2/5/TPMF4]